MLLPLAVAYDLKLEKMDVKTTFIHAYLKEDIFMEKP